LLLLVSIHPGRLCSVDPGRLRLPLRTAQAAPLSCAPPPPLARPQVILPLFPFGAVNKRTAGHIGTMRRTDLPAYDAEKAAHP
jgi:hypothetical protein